MFRRKNKKKRDVSPPPLTPPSRPAPLPDAVPSVSVTPAAAAGGAAAPAPPALFVYSASAVSRSSRASTAASTAAPPAAQEALLAVPAQATQLGSWRSSVSKTTAVVQEPSVFETELLVRLPKDKRKSILPGGDRGSSSSSPQGVGAGPNAAVGAERRLCSVSSRFLTIVKTGGSAATGSSDDDNKVKAQVSLLRAKLVDHVQVASTSTVFEFTVEPDGEPAITLIAPSREQKDVWLRVLANLIARCTFGSDDDLPLMWRHRIVRGTLFAAALSGNVHELDKFVQEISGSMVAATSGLVIHHVHRGQEDLVREVKSLIETKDDDGYLPMHCAAASGEAEAIDWLVSRGCDITAQASDGRTSLHLAASFGHREVVERLLSLGAEPNLRTSLTRPTPLDECLGCVDDAKMCITLVILLDHGAREHLVQMSPDLGTRLERLRGPTSTTFLMGMPDPADTSAPWFQLAGPLSVYIPQLAQIAWHFNSKVVRIDRDKWPRETLARLADRHSWTPDSRALDCTICRAQFTWFYRKHHCRWCKQIVCGACSSKGLWTGSYFEGTERLCDGCFNVFYSKYALPLSSLEVSESSAAADEKAGNKKAGKGRKLSLYNEIGSVKPGPPDSGSPPKSPAQSPEKPFGSMIANKLVPLGVGKLFGLVFENDSDWKRNFHQKRGDKDLEITKWAGQKRLEKYSTPNQSKLVNANHLPVEEVHTLVFRKDKQCYVVDVALIADGIPYSDCFLINVRYILTHEQKGIARVNVSLAMEWRKSTMMKDLILKAACSVVRNYMRALFQVLKDTKL